MMADKVFLNGEVVTVDKRNNISEAVAIKNNKILAVGTNESIKSFIHSDTKKIDLKGRSLLPGFIDSHLHFTTYGADKFGVSCKASHIKSLGDILVAIKEKCKSTPEGQWVRAWGFNETKINEKIYPTRYDLDKISEKHPIVIVRTCSHISVANSLALKLANIDENTPDPDGGKIERDKNGVPTGDRK